MAQDTPVLVTPGNVVGEPSLGTGKPTEEREITMDNGSGKAGNGHTFNTRQRFVRRAKRKEQSPLRVFCTWVVDNQIGLSINLLLLLFGTHFLFPRARTYTSKFIYMSSYDQPSNTYITSPENIYFVMFWVVAITGLRAAIMDYVLQPIARWGGISTKKGLVRFAEQGWLFLYTTTSFSLGMYIISSTKYFRDFRELWTEWPTRTVNPVMNWYYLVQFAFWVQQIFVVHIEERRKDHWQMLTHHIFTCALVGWSYGCYQTKVGNVIFCIMDVVDILLAFAKMLNYLNFRKTCDIAFGVFLVSWLIARHFIYLAVCWSIWAHLPVELVYGCYNFPSSDPTVPGSLILGSSDSALMSNLLHAYRDPTKVVCYNSTMSAAFLGLLFALQGLTVIWFVMILGVAYRVLTGKGAEDSRSDDEAEDEIEIFEYEDDVEFAIHNGGPVQESSKHILQYQEEEVGVEGLHQVKKRSAPATRSRSRRTGGRASGISIPGHGDRKELLGRIGCDKPI